MKKRSMLIQDLKLLILRATLIFIELPRSLNVPENVICYITDVVIPVSWSTIDARNNNLYMYIERGGEKIYKNIAIAKMNYNGATFSAALQDVINAALTGILSFDVLYDWNDNLITVKQRDNFDVKATLACGADLLAGIF